MLIALFIFIICLLSFMIMGYAISGPKYTGAINDHFDGKKFINPGGVQAKGLTDVLKWSLNRKRGPWKEITSATPYPKPLPRVEEGLRITFINHSTFLIQVDGLNILTDPVWSERTSPYSFVGPKRMRPPGIPFEDLPAIDVVVLSHNHYDHLDLDTMKRIFSIHRPRIITPLGVKAYLQDNQISGTADLDWWDEFPLSDDLSVVATPAQHFSGRGTFDRDATLWCGYLIKRKGGKNIYFAGDSGYNTSTFKEIGQRGAPIDVALIPIGAYKPEWFMSPIHCSPEEAVRIHIDLDARQSIATHFGTFPLADEGKDEPVNDLMLGLTRGKISPGNFIAMNEGEARSF